MNKKVTILSTTVLSDAFFRLENVHFELLTSNEKIEEQKREVYNSSNGATALLYNTNTESVILIRQFRLASHLTGNKGGMMIEACAGLIENDDDAPSTIIREIEEETGYRVQHVEKLFELYSSPGATTEKLHYFVAEYDPSNKVHEGGGLDEEQEDIEVLELPFDEAWFMVTDGTIADAKTVILLQHARMNIFTSNKVFNIL